MLSRKGNICVVLIREVGLEGYYHYELMKQQSRVTLRHQQKQRQWSEH